MNTPQGSDFAGEVFGSDRPAQPGRNDASSIRYKGRVEMTKPSESATGGQGHLDST